MKRIFYKGLLALTLAFGIASCDKDDNGGAAVNALSLEAQGLASKVTFGESGSSIVIPKLKGEFNLTGKTHSQFTPIYSTASQTLSITGGDVDYNGTYVAGNISTLDPASIILANGDYVATSSNVNNDGIGVIGGFLPYTSTKAFNLSESGNITLLATLLRGFLIVNAQAEAADTNRVQSAKIFLDAGDGSTPTGLDLIKDADGDYYAYLEAGSYDVEVTYLLNGVEKIVRGTKVIANGSAYTLNLSLTDDTVVERGTESDVSSETYLESEIPADSPAPVFTNEDNDLLDTVSRVVTSTFTTTDGVRDVGQTPSVVYGEWVVIATSNDLGVGESDTSTGDGGESTGDESDPSPEVPPTDTASDTISYDGVFTEDADSRTAGLITGTVWVFGGSDYATLAEAQAAADLTGTSLDVVIVERASYADDTFTQTQGFSVVVQGGIADVPAPEADAAILTESSSEANANEDTNVPYTTTAAAVVNVWEVNNGVHSHADYVGYSFTVSPAPLGLSGFTANITSPESASGTSVALNQQGSSSDLVITAAQAEIVRAFTAN